MNNLFYFSKSSRHAAFALSALVLPASARFTRASLRPCPTSALFSELNLMIHRWPIVTTFRNSSLLRTKKRQVCVGRSHRAAAAVIIHTKRRKRRWAGYAGRLALLHLACLGDQICANHRHDLLKVALFCSLGRSGLRFESLMPLYSATIFGQASSVFSKTFFSIFFFLVNILPLLLTGKVNTTDHSKVQLCMYCKYF